MSSDGEQEPGKGTVDGCERVAAVPEPYGTREYGGGWIHLLSREPGRPWEGGWNTRPMLEAEEEMVSFEVGHRTCAVIPSDLGFPEEREWTSEEEAMVAEIYHYTLKALARAFDERVATELRKFWQTS